MAGAKFQTQAWDIGYTIGITQVDVYAKKVGSPTASVGCKLYTNAGVLVATSDTTYAASDLDTSAEELSFVFTAGDMSQETL